MATPMTADQELAALAAEGCTVVEVAGWRTRNRAGHGAWGPVHGVVVHHTGAEIANDQAATYAAGLLSNGYTSLPGPLCQSGEAPDGRIFMVGNGRCNHAGGGDPNVLDAVVADAVPMDSTLKPARGNLDGVDGNARFYGLEVMRSGLLPWPQVQYDNAVRWCAAICRFHGWTAASVIGHKEWSDDKIDPGSTDMGAFRRDVAAALALPAGRWRNATPAPATPTQESNDMTPQQAADLTSTLGAAREARERANQAVNGVKTVMATTAEIDSKVDALSADIATIKAALDALKPTG